MHPALAAVLGAAGAATLNEFESFAETYINLLGLLAFTPITLLVGYWAVKKPDKKKQWLESYAYALMCAAFSTSVAILMQGSGSSWATPVSCVLAYAVGSIALLTVRGL